MAQKIKEINVRLDRIAKQRSDLHLREGDGGLFRERVPDTVSLIHESDVLGRENDKEKLVNLLVSDGSVAKELSVIPIIGMGGLGKTTLAQLVYNDQRVEKHFDIRGWVCVSDDFNLKRLAKAIIESTSKQPSNYEELNSLAEEIKKIVSGKKFLLVLDDVWNEDFSKWEILIAPLRFGGKGSKIIITTRSEKISQIMGTIDGYSLGILSDEDCFLLLGKRAFPTQGWDEHQDLVAVGKEIAKKCSGLPLAAKTLGGLLKGTREESKWKDILNSEIWELPQGKYDILAPLRLSYHHLPSHLKQCFLYCSIFPKDYEFDKEKMVKLWMGEGFITSYVGQREMEDVGSEYFDDLLRRSFFQCEKEEDGELKYKMHDLIHDLAQSVSEGECFRMEDNILFPVSEKARYSSCITYEGNVSTIFETFLKCKKLHTLLLLRVGVRVEFESIPNNLFQQIKFFRVLDLSGGRIKELPNSIGNLKHLRYLNLSYTNIKRLPESTSYLYNLQTLDLSYSYELVELPKDTRNLINLRHLTFWSGNIRSTPEGIGGLTCLRTLSDFVVGKETGHEIGQLMRLINLRGRLQISGLQNVVNAKKDVLNNKQYIEELYLSWGSHDDDHDAIVKDEILEGLRPHPNLRMLSIKGYNGERFPSWIGDPSLSKLVHVKLWGCRSCQTLPPLGQLPSLKILRIYKMDKVRHDGIMISKAFPTLEELYMESIPNLVEWGGGTVEGDFPCLRKLDIKRCESLIALPRFLTSLCELSLEICNVRILNSLSYFTSLSSLEIMGLENLKVIPVQSLKNLKALKKLIISGCKELVSLVEDDEDCKHLHSLESLRIFYCPQLMVLPGLQHLTSLQVLSLLHLPQLTSLPDGLENHISLKDLYIQECERLSTMPKEGLPNTLQSLYISKCPLLAQRCQKECGEDWPKISHIPYIQILDFFWPQLVSTGLC